MSVCMYYMQHRYTRHLYLPRKYARECFVITFRLDNYYDFKQYRNLIISTRCFKIVHSSFVLFNYVLSTIFFNNTVIHNQPTEFSRKKLLRNRFVTKIKLPHYKNYYLSIITIPSRNFLHISNPFKILHVISLQTFFSTPFLG